jgi:hypothetical protein
VSSRLFNFVGGTTGPWRVDGSKTILGEALPKATHLDVVAGVLPGPPAGAAWVLRGVTSNERYVTRPEKQELLARQPATGRPEATSAALILLRKSAAWWALTQDERRAIFEDRSRHIQIGLEALPAVARRLHHCRDLESEEPFDFLTWFEFAPADAPVFEALTERLRASDEWKFVDREAEFRLVRSSACNAK